MVGIGRQAKLRGRAVGAEASIQRLFHPVQVQGMKSRPTGAVSVERWQPIGLLMVPKVGNLPWRHATLPVLTALAIGFIPRYDWW